MGVLVLLCWVSSFSQKVERLSLHDAIEIALQNNPEVLRARREIDGAEGRILQAGRIPNPEIEISLNEMPSLFKFGDADARDISISQQVEFPTKRSNRIDVAATDKTIAQLLMERSKIVVTSQVKRAYYNLLFSQEIVSSLEGQLKLLKDFQQLVTSRFEAGASNYLDVVRSKVEIARTTNDLTEARREALIRQTQLNLVLGRSGVELMVLTDSLVYVPVTTNQDSLVQYLTAKSSALRIARQTLLRQQSVLSLAKTNYLPDFTVGVSHQRAAEQPPFNANDYRGVTTNSFGIRFGVSVPLWFWQEPRGQVQESGALVEIARVSNAATERRVKAGIANALQSVNAADSQLQVFDASLLGDANDILTTGITQYRNNQIDVLNLLDIYRTYRASRIEYLRALTNSLVARADLEAASEQLTE